MFRWSCFNKLRPCVRTRSRACCRRIEKGNNFSRPSIIEKEVAEKFLSMVGTHDMIKFAKNGSVVTTAAVKLARAYTGRKIVARPAEHPFILMTTGL